MAVGSSMLATIRTAPPQWAQVVMSMEKTRLSRCAQLIARRFCSGLRGSSWALTSTGAASPAGRLPRPEGVSCARRFAFGANTPWKRVRCARGGGALCRFVWKRFASCRHGWRERTGRGIPDQAIQVISCRGVDNEGLRRAGPCEHVFLVWCRVLAREPFGRCGRDRHRYRRYSELFSSLLSLSSLSAGSSGDNEACCTNADRKSRTI